MNVLVISAHPDDETLGCGGTLLKHGARGDKLYWIIATSPYPPKWSSEVIASKSVEIDRVAAAYPVENCFRLGFPAGGLDTVPFINLMDGVRTIAERVRPAIVYVVHGGDVHGDHRILFQAVTSVFKPFHLSRFGTRRMLCYETMSSTEAAPSNGPMPFIPNVFCEITSFVDRKLEILRLFETEMQADLLPRGVSAVRAHARIRGATIGAEYAEAFHLVLEAV